MLLLLLVRPALGLENLFAGIPFTVYHNGLESGTTNKLTDGSVDMNQQAADYYNHESPYTVDYDLNHIWTAANFLPFKTLLFLTGVSGLS